MIEIFSLNKNYIKEYVIISVLFYGSDRLL